MAYTNMTLSDLPAKIDLRIGTDSAEYALQLSYWQIWAAIQALHAIDSQNLYPEEVVNAGDQSSFDTAITNLVSDLTAAMVHFDEIWAMVA